MSEDNKCSACGAVLKQGLSLMEPGPAPRCAACGATLDAVEAEQPYTIEFASDQCAQRRPKNAGGITDPALRAGSVIPQDSFRKTATQEGESP